MIPAPRHQVTLSRLSLPGCVQNIVERTLAVSAVPYVIPDLQNLYIAE